MDKHCLIRTNVGGSFIGRCIACGKEDIPICEASGCSNPKDLSDKKILSDIFEVV